MSYGTYGDNLIHNKQRGTYFMRGEEWKDHDYRYAMQTSTSGTVDTR